MKKLNAAISLALTLFLFSSCSFMRKNNSSVKLTPEQQLAQQQEMALQAKLDQLTPGWPTQSRLAAKATFEKYGDPSEVTGSMLIWKLVAPFKRITVYKEELTHKFPILHMDVIEHVVDFKVPVDKVDDLAAFNGSLIVDLTRGELMARGDQEQMNVLALNLASEIISGELRANNARIEYGKRSMEFMNGIKGNYTESLFFGHQINTAQADQSISDKIKWVQAQEEAPRKRQLRSAPVPKRNLLPMTNPPMRQAPEQIAE